MSDAELRKQSRYTWLLVAFSALVIFLMAQQSRATTNAHAEKYAYKATACLLVYNGSISS